MLSVDRSKARHYGDEHGRYWAVSQVCDVVTGGKGHADEAAMQRGTDVHQIFALAVGSYAGLCDGPEVLDEYRGYYEAILQWISQAQPKPSKLEQAMKHRIYPYAGTMDYVGSIGEEFGVLDLKTGQPEKWHAVQLHGYQKMLDRAAKMWALYIDRNGTYKQVPVKASARHWAVFQNGLSILRWRESV